MPSLAPPRRSWFSYSVRTMLVALTAFAVWLGWMVNGARRQREAVEAVQQVGIRMSQRSQGRAAELLRRRAFVLYDYQIGSQVDPEKAHSWVPAPMLKLLGVDFFHNVVRIHINGPMTDETLKYIGRLPRLQSLELYDSHFVGDPDYLSDAGLAQLAGLRTVKRLRLQIRATRGARISDQGMLFLAGMPQLRHLSITGYIPLTDDLMPTIERLTQLEWLELNNTKITSAGLKYLAALKKLSTLGLSGGSITDDGIPWIAELPNLGSLFLDGTRVTGTGLKPLAALDKLVALDLTATDVTDDDLPEVGGLRGLTQLALSGPNVSGEGLAQLKELVHLGDIWVGTVEGDLTPFSRACPNCQMHYSPRPPFTSSLSRPAD